MMDIRGREEAIMTLFAKPLHTTKKITVSLYAAIEYLLPFISSPTLLAIHSDILPYAGIDLCVYLSVDISSPRQ